MVNKIEQSLITQFKVNDIATKYKCNYLPKTCTLRIKVVCALA